METAYKFNQDVGATGAEFVEGQPTDVTPDVERIADRFTDVPHTQVGGKVFNSLKKTQNRR